MPLEARTIRYMASDVISCNEIAGILGAAIGKPELKWIVIQEVQLLYDMIAAGINSQIAACLAEMYARTYTATFFEDY